MKISVAKLPNKNLDQTLRHVLGEEWSVRRTDDFWWIELRSKTFPNRLFENTQHVVLKKNGELVALKECLGLVEIESEHEEAIRAMGGGPQIQNFTKWGLNSWLYSGKSAFNFKRLNEFDELDQQFLETLRNDFRTREAIVYRKNFKPFLALTRLRIMAYFLRPKDEVGEFSLDGDHFEGTLPSAYDFSSYIDPFLTFAPITLAFPLDRLCSGIILIPEKSFLSPFIANTGWSELLITPLSGYSRHEGFSLFGANNEITRIFLRRFLKNLTDAFNDFFGWLFNPINSSDDKGEYSAGYGLQLLATTHSILKSFGYAARNLDADEKQIHIFTVFDRLTNLAANRSFLKNGKLGTPTSTIESAMFSCLFDRDFAGGCSALLKRKLQVDQVSERISKSAESALGDLEKSFKHFGVELGKALRTLRNTSHGAFLKNDEFLRTFSKGPIEVTPQLSCLCYLYVLCFIVEPDQFLLLLTNVHKTKVK